ncbi:staphylococcal nuclease domain-containing protein 1-like [Acanthaster planci]|uniref:Staphylococcal nuclease domain-containing protein 1 n=1 Tax=Acanthaster planci TaxID=133434 RepID=A0A8B8A2N1_ACAPL|nr:staphylococcal nuclease domain-containing protein 1-like [Acanthaster planci]
MAAQSQQQNFMRGIVKQVQSGDAVIIRGQPKGGPPPEKQICLSNVTAPKLAKKANPNIATSVETKDEPYAWEAREYLRKKLIGKEVHFTVEYSVPGSGRAYGCIYLPTGKDQTPENVTESIVAEGLVEVRRGGIKPSDDQNKLILLEDTAKAAKKGKWAGTASGAGVRDVHWAIENPRNFVDSLHGKEQDAVIEHVRDGCTVRAFLIPSFHHVTVMLSGIKCPMFRRDGDSEVAEPFAMEAKYFTESRLLQRDVKIILEGVSNQNFLGSIIHPKGNIAEFLLAEGLARCVDWSIATVTHGAENLRAAEKKAKEKQSRIWKDYKSKAVPLNIEEKTYTGKVVEVVNADALLLKTASGEYRKVTLSSIRPPRLTQPAKDSKENGKDEEPSKPERRIRPLYDVPYMFEAREFLRKKLIGKKVNVSVDYIKPANDGYPEKTCVTVTIGGINVAEALVSKGLCSVIRYRQDDDQRSAHYDALLTAETRAIKNSKGIHSKKEYPIHRIADLSGEAQKAKQFLPFLQRAGRSNAIIFSKNASDVRLNLNEPLLLSLLSSISGITCPKMARTGPGGPTESEPFSEEALQYTKELVLQREVEVEVESIDKAGNFIGWLFVEGVNLSVALVEQGLSKMHFTAERSNYARPIQAAEEKAKTAKLKVWEKYEEPKTLVTVEETAERKTNYKRIIVTEIGNELDFYAQLVESGPQFEKFMEQLRAEILEAPPLPGSFSPKKGDMCVAKFVDGEWYRARVEKVYNKDKSLVFFLDYGNSDFVTSANIGAMPPGYHTQQPQARHFHLACVTLPKDDEFKQEALEAVKRDILNAQLLYNTEYRVGSAEYVTLLIPDSKEDVGKGLVSEGFLLAEQRREKRLQKMVAEYVLAQQSALKAHLNLWRYGDITEDDAREFGYQA